VYSTYQSHINKNILDLLQQKGPDLNLQKIDLENKFKTQKGLLSQHVEELNLIINKFTPEQKNLIKDYDLTCSHGLSKLYEFVSTPQSEEKPHFSKEVIESVKLCYEAEATRFHYQCKLEHLVTTIKEYESGLYIDLSKLKKASKKINELYDSSRSGIITGIARMTFVGGIYIAGKELYNNRKRVRKFFTKLPGRLLG
jgi:hypothetical protein